MSETVKVSVCSPIHNEEANVDQLIERVHAVMNPMFGSDWEQVLVNDASTDSSKTKVEAQQKVRPTLKLYNHETNMRERAGWRTAFDHAKGEVLVLLAGDLQSPPEEIPKVLAPVTEEGFDLGTGFRSNRQDGVYYWLATRILNLFMRVVFGTQTQDVSSSFFAVKQKFVKNMDMIENDHRYILAIFVRRGASMKEVPFKHAARVAGKSHYNKSKVLYAVPEIARFWMRWSKGYYD
jgi:glycosyltransferase involved in cell wall biosynthesis